MGAEFKHIVSRWDDIQQNSLAEFGRWYAEFQTVGAALQIRDAASPAPNKPKLRLLYGCSNDSESPLLSLLVVVTAEWGILVEQVKMQIDFRQIPVLPSANSQAILGAQSLAIYATH